MKAHRRGEAQIHSFLTSAPEGGEWSTLCSGRFTPGKRRRYPLYRRLCGRQSRYGISEKGKPLAPTAIRTPDRAGRGLVAKPAMLFRFLEFIGYMYELS